MLCGQRASKMLVLELEVGGTRGRSVKTPGKSCVRGLGPAARAPRVSGRCPGGMDPGVTHRKPRRPQPQHASRFWMTILVIGGYGFIGSNFILDWISGSTEPVLNVDKVTYAGNLKNLAAVAGLNQCSFPRRYTLKLLPRGFTG